MNSLIAMESTLNVLLQCLIYQYTTCHYLTELILGIKLYPPLFYLDSNRRFASEFSGAISGEGGKVTRDFGSKTPTPDIFIAQVY